MCFKSIALAATSILFSTSVNSAVITLNLSGFITIPDGAGNAFSVNVSYESNTPYDSNYSLNYAFQGAITAVSGSINLNDNTPDGFDVYISGGDPVNTNVLNAAGFGSDSSFGFSVGYIDSGTGMSLTADFFETMPIYGFNAMIIPAYATSDTLGTLDLDAYTGFSPEGKGVFNILTDIGDLGGIITEVNIVPVSAVPVPGAVWLFGSGLIGLIGVARRKQS